MIIAFDLDNTLCEPIKKSDDVVACLHVEPIEFYVELAKELKKRGHRILIFTHRHECTRPTTKLWLVMNKVPHDELIMGKPKYDVLIDDKVLPPYNYLTPKIVEQYADHVSHWDWEKGSFKRRREE